MNKIKELKGFGKGIIFLILGLALVSGSLLSTNGLRQKYNGTCVATITKVSETQNSNVGTNTSYTNYVTYEVDGVKYENMENEPSVNPMHLGDTVKISYNVNNPSEFVTQTNTVALALKVCGWVIVFLGILSSIENLTEKFYAYEE